MIRRGRYKLITYRNPVTHAGDHAGVIADLNDAIDAWDRSRRITPPTVSGYAADLRRGS